MAATVAFVLEANPRDKDHVYFNGHVCSPPSTANLIGREMDFGCKCERRW
jgi:hypothetical protein